MTLINRACFVGEPAKAVVEQRGNQRSRPAKQGSTYMTATAKKRNQLLCAATKWKLVTTFGSGTPKTMISAQSFYRCPYGVYD